MLNKIHFYYLLIIWVLITSFVTGLSLYKSSAMVDIISISSAAISIIIGFLAIFISLYQGLTQNTSIQKLNESATRVEKATKELDLKVIKEQISNIGKHIMKESPDLIGPSKLEGDKIVLSDLQIKTVFLPNILGVHLMYYLMITYKENVDFDLYKFAKKYVKNRNLTDGNDYIYLGASVQSLKLASRTPELELSHYKIVAKVTKMSERLLKIIEEVVSKNKEQLKYLEEII